jgi:hypothetical protein
VLRFLCKIKAKIIFLEHSKTKILIGHDQQNSWFNAAVAIARYFGPLCSHNKIDEITSSHLAGLNKLGILDLSANMISLIQAKKVILPSWIQKKYIILRLI